MNFEELSKSTVVEIADILSDHVEITATKEDFYGALDEVYDLLIEKFEQVHAG